MTVGYTTIDGVKFYVPPDDPEKCPFHGHGRCYYPGRDGLGMLWKDSECLGPAYAVNGLCPLKTK